jgi:Domain of unknown function (DUF4383)
MATADRGMEAGRPAAERTPAQLFALVFGVVYLLIGIVGFFVANEFTGGTKDDTLIIFHVNHLHNIIHLAIGAVWIAASRKHDTAKMVNTAIGVVYLLVALLGFLLPDSLMHTLINTHGAGDPDNFLHLVSGALSLYFGTAGAGDRDRVTRTA